MQTFLFFAALAGIYIFLELLVTAVGEGLFAALGAGCKIVKEWVCGKSSKAPPAVSTPDE